MKETKQWVHGCLLEAYKARDIVERDFGFLKDELIVNSLFLKSPARIEALGLVLVLSLMIWRLMERTMRMFLKERETTHHRLGKTADLTAHIVYDDHEIPLGHRAPDQLRTLSRQPLR